MPFNFEDPSFHPQIFMWQILVEKYGYISFSLLLQRKISKGENINVILYLNLYEADNSAHSFDFCVLHK